MGVISEGFSALSGILIHQITTVIDNFYDYSKPAEQEKVKITCRVAQVFATALTSASLIKMSKGFSMTNFRPTSWFSTVPYCLFTAYSLILAGKLYLRKKKPEESSALKACAITEQATVLLAKTINCALLAGILYLSVSNKGLLAPSSTALLIIMEASSIYSIYRDLSYRKKEVMLPSNALLSI